MYNVHIDLKNKGMRGSCGGIGFPDLVMHERDEMNKDMSMVHIPVLWNGNLEVVKVILKKTRFPRQREDILADAHGGLPKPKFIYSLLPKSRRVSLFDYETTKVTTKVVRKDKDEDYYSVVLTYLLKEIATDPVTGMIQQTLKIDEPISRYGDSVTEPLSYSKDSCLPNPYPIPRIVFTEPLSYTEDSCLPNPYPIPRIVFTEPLPYTEDSVYRSQHNRYCADKPILLQGCCPGVAPNLI
ncbi:hypothetical protein LXL04_024538 [Taraxacum kok-saghyz]